MSNDRNRPRAVTSLAAAARTTPHVLHPDDDPRVAALRAAIAWLSHELAAYPATLPDRPVAQEALSDIDTRAATGHLTAPTLRASLLTVAGALGSISALALPLTALRRAADPFFPGH
ncbi:DUF5955 family protein [Streptantibioticus silvisoli]|uniref:DUF5955 family protein n=1 Tax=Streptantibioticus silvisoli TaxID=2705255 RepID=A0ABT6W0H3_9ACTN|nr:DUF5955 family protein [Streptantibioticus silvisoli]MDI5964244.1 DUF5955 family protein [Streptantibioticus silvisoli]